MRLGKIKYAAIAVACVSARNCFNLAKGWHFVCRFIVGLMSVALSVMLAPKHFKNLSLATVIIYALQMPPDQSIHDFNNWKYHLTKYLTITICN